MPFWRLASLAIVWDSKNVGSYKRGSSVGSVREVPYPIVLYVDNAAGVSYQHSTCAASRLRRVYDQRKAWIKELKDQPIVIVVKVATEHNLADLYTKCHSAATMKKLQEELERLQPKFLVHIQQGAREIDLL